METSTISALCNVVSKLREIGNIYSAESVKLFAVYYFRLFVDNDRSIRCAVVVLGLKTEHLGTRARDI
jgi:hypothetical protein